MRDRCIRGNAEVRKGNQRRNGEMRSNVRDQETRRREKESDKRHGKSPV